MNEIQSQQRWFLIGLVTFLSFHPFSEGFSEDRHQAARGVFQKMVQAASLSDKAVPRGGDARFIIVDGDPLPGDKPYKCGIAVWFQLKDGRYVNPTKHKWIPKEQFKVWFQSATPVTISLHQNYPEDRPESRQVYPDERIPETFRSFDGRKAELLPVPFKMDDDLRDEIMSMVVVRGDSGLLPIEQTLFGGAGNTGESGPGAVMKGKTASLYRQFNDQARETGKINGENSRFTIVGPETMTCPEFSEVPEDVQFFMFGSGYAHQFQITLKK